MEPLVSIGIPVKNGFSNKSEKDINLEKALHSILNQSYSNLEIIISNNNSNDKTNIFLENISKTDKRLKIYKQSPEIFINENFAFVLNKASGKYFKWNGADDILSSDFIEKNVEFLENNSDYSFSSSKFWFESNKDKIYINNLNEDLFRRLKNFLNIRFESHNMFHGLIRKKYLPIAQTCSNNLGHDWATCIGLLTIGKFKTLDEAHIVFGDKGISKSKDFFKYEWHNKKKIYTIIPFYEFSRYFFKLVFFLKLLSYSEKIILWLMCIKLNLSFIKRKYRNKFNISIK